MSAARDMVQAGQMPTQMAARHLPRVLREVADALGLPLALDMARTLGGTTVKVPKGSAGQGRATWDELARVLGVRGAAELCRVYGGEELYIPRCDAALRQARNASLVSEFDAETRFRSGQDVVAELARKYQLSDRQVWKILKAAPAGPQEQLSLFGGGV